ncbi:MAG: hypothetical protein NC936_00410 [Candidatus Omnitrophica bacterium]|nr:hypothetical protein [Candidatus Omnitrophota bacterium]
MLKKKVLIIYASSGAGHYVAAQAAYDYLKDCRQELDISIVDILERTNKIFRIFYIHGYSFLVNHATIFWHFLFWITYLKLVHKLTRPILRLVNWLNARDFVTFLCKENPDFIISTHFFPSEISAGLKKKGKINSKIVTVITDFGVHPFWVSDGIDTYIVASKFTENKLIQEGIAQDRIKILGVPIHKKFFKSENRDIVYKRLGLGENEFTVLIVTGSFGIGPIEKIVDLLYKDTKLVVVCARNKKLYTRLERKNYDNVYVYGFVNNIDELMTVSDIIITKPGGISIAEVLAKGLVPIFISPIPGQETENLKAMQNYGIGIYPRRIKDIKDIVLDYKTHPQKLDIVKENIKKLKETFLPEDLCNVIC